MTAPDSGRAAASDSTWPAAQSEVTARLPTWPVGALFVGFPLWWLVGFVDIAWIIFAGFMLAILLGEGGAKVPRGFGVWLVFLAWAAASAMMLHGGMALVGFGYRFGLYVAATVIAVYIYNARETLTERYVSGCLTAWFVTTTVGGYLGIVLPSTVVRTPMAYVLSDSLMSNQLVNHMVVRRFAQYNADSFLNVAARPSAPFLYTNNWGNVYSLLLPFVVVYLWHVRGTIRFWVLCLVVAASTVPALLTLNRGMFIGVALSMLYAAVRLAVMGRFKAIGGLGLICLIGVVAFQVLPVEQRLNARLDSNSADATSNDTRASLYLQAIQLVPESPFFGFGAPQEGQNSGAAPVGTQGQVWMLLVSHGPIATFAFVAWFLLAFWRSRHRRDPTGLACQTVLLVGTVELLYYGMVPNGLPIMMVAAALALRGADSPRSPGSRHLEAAPDVVLPREVSAR